MSDSKRMLIWMLLFLAVVAAVGVALFPPLCSAFLASEVFNGMIFGVLLIGAGIDFLPVLMKMFSGREQEGFRLSATTMRSLSEGIQLRLHESRDISRHVTGLLILLGRSGHSRDCSIPSSAWDV